MPTLNQHGLNGKGSNTGESSGAAAQVPVSAAVGAIGFAIPVGIGIGLGLSELVPVLVGVAVVVVVVVVVGVVIEQLMRWLLHNESAGPKESWDDGQIVPGVDLDWKDGTQPPAEGWEWKGKDAPGGPRGGWVRPGSGGRESLHPDLDHAEPIGPHWDWNTPDGKRLRIFPDGRVEPKPGSKKGR